MYELVIENGNIIDVIKGEIYNCDIGISGGRIVALSKEKIEGIEKIDAKGMMVSPGFVDIHMHEDSVFTNEEGVIEIKEDIFKAMAKMGVTTCIGGNCGIVEADIKDYLGSVDRHGLSVNYGTLLGYSTLREKVGASDKYKACTEKEMEEIKKLIREGLSYGAAGVSLGIEYTPGSTTNELIEIAKTVKEFENRLLTVHFRADSKRSVESIKEMIHICWVADIPLQISHIGSNAAYGMMEEALSVVENAKDIGVNVLADCYPYVAFSTHVGSAVFDDGCFERWNSSYEMLIITEGKYKGKKCTKEIFDYIRKNEPYTYVVASVMDQNDVDLAMVNPFVMVASDGGIHNGQGHPRAAGAFPKVLRKYVREDNSLTLIEAIKKMTLMPAERLKLKNKGAIFIGADADITIFDKDKVADRATFENPITAPEGIEYVVINGKIAVDKNKKLLKRYGKSIRF